VPAQITANGSNFASDAEVEWNGTALTTSYFSSSLLTAQVPAGDLGAATTAQVTVVNPGPAGGMSGAITFTVQAPIPILTSITPATATAGDGAITLAATGNNFQANSQIMWNGAARQTTFVSSTQLTTQVPASDLAAASSSQISVMTPGPGGGTSRTITFYVAPAGTRISKVEVYANGMVWDAGRGRIYASVNSADTGKPNTIAVIDPVAGKIDSTVSAGSQPNLLSESSDGTYLWVGEDGNGAVQRFKLPTLTPDITIPIPSSASYGTLTAIDLQAAPGAPHTAAILEGSFSIDPPAVGGLHIFDDATPRPTSTQSGGLAAILDWVQWGADSSALYGGNSGIPPSFYSLAVNSSGVTTTGVFSYLTSGNGHYDPATGDIYADNGQVVRAATSEADGDFSLSSLSGSTYCAVDSTQGVVYFLGKGFTTQFAGYWVIEAFDQKTDKLLRTLLLPPINGVPVQLMRWGNAGLAFRVLPYPYATAQPVIPAVYLVDGAFVNSSATPDSTLGPGVQVMPALQSIAPQSVTAGSPDTVLTVAGNNFENGSVVYWDNHALSTTYVSATQLQAAVPANDLASVGSHAIQVSDGDVQTLDTPVLVFTVTAANSGIAAFNLASLDVAWDKANGLLYAAVWSDDLQYPNSILAIDPVKAKVVASQPAGPDPYLVRTTADGAYLYSANLTTDKVIRFNLPGLTSALTWSLGLQPPNSSNPNVWQQSLIALDVQPAPGAPQTTAVATGALQYISDWIANGHETVPGGSLTVYDGNVARSTAVTETYNGYYSVQWGVDSSTLYAGSSSLDTITVNTSGATVSNSFATVFSSTGVVPITYDAGTGYLYDSTGRAIDPKTGNIVGQYATAGTNSSGLVVPDSSLNLVFILGQTKAQLGSSDYTITAYNQKTFAAVSSFVVPSVTDLPYALIRWGTSGLALVTYSSYNDTVGLPAGMLYILNEPAFVTATPTFSGNVIPPVPVERTWKIQPLPGSPIPQASQRD